MSASNFVSKEMLERAIEQAGMLEDDYINFSHCSDLEQLDRVNITHNLLQQFGDDVISDISDFMEVDASFLATTKCVKALEKVAEIIGHEIDYFLPILTNEFNERQKIGE